MQYAAAGQNVGDAMITSESCCVSCGCRSAGECHHNDFSELDALYLLVDEFAREMKIKLRKKWQESRGGWDNPAAADFLRSSMIEHVLRGPGQEIDIANFAAMLWNMRQT